MTDSTPRPSQTTLAAGMVMVGSALVVVTVGEQIAALNSLQTRESVTEFLASAPGTGLDVPATLVLLRTALMVVAGCATAAGVLGFHVLRRSRSARLGLTVLAVPLFFIGMTTGGFLTSLVAFATIWLWIEPSRAWLEGRALPEPPQRPDPAARAAANPWAAPPSAPPEGGPPPHTGQYGAPVPPPLAPPPPAVPEQRPSALLWACIVTWAFCSLTVVLLTASLTLLLADPSVIWAELERQNPTILADSGLTRDDVARTAYVTLGVGIAWAIAASLLALLTYRGNPSGRLGLVISASIAAVLCLAGAVGAALLVVPGVACAASAGLLVRSDVRAWFAARQHRP